MDQKVGWAFAALHALDAKRWTRIAGDIRREVQRHAMLYRQPHEPARSVPMALRPLFLSPEQRQFLRGLSLAVRAAAVRVHRAWFERGDVRALLPLTEGELEWIREAYGRRPARAEALFARADVSMHPDRPGWRAQARILEANLVGLGAVYYAFCAGQIASELFAPLLSQARVRPEDDLLEMLLGECRGHGARIGRPDPTVALLERRRASGPCEYAEMARVFQSRGERVLVADPSELELGGGELFCRGTRVDVVYRDPTLHDLVALERAGADMRPLRLAFRRNQVVSSLAGELDHKGLLELLSSSRFSSLLPPGARRLLSRHIPWTRVVRAARVDGPDGRDVDLLEHVRRRRASLVLKPNRAYGGEGVHVGARTSQAAWDALVDAAARRPCTWVAQAAVPIPEDGFPLVSRGGVRWERRYFVLGVHATSRRVAALGRMSESAIVNITRGGAVVGVLEGEPRAGSARR